MAAAAAREPRHPGAEEYDVVAVGASAGGVHGLLEIVAALPVDFPVSVVVVLHLDPRHRSVLAEILGRRTSLEVRQAAAGDRLDPGTILIAPPNRHVLVGESGALELSDSELVHFVRPSIDLLFESIAASHGERAIAVVLSGTGNDGAMGVEAVKKVGGTVIVEDDRTAEFAGMPRAAIETGCVDFVLPLDEIAPALVTLVTSGDGR